MSEISYPVVGDAPPCRTSVWSSDGAEVCNCRTEGTAVDGEARARRIAAALNATRHLTVDQLEACDGVATYRDKGGGMFDFDISQFTDCSSGDAAKGE